MANTDITPGRGEVWFGLEYRKPASAALSLTGIAPSVQISGSKLITPLTQTLKIGLDLSNPIITINAASQLTITSFAPTVNQTQQPVRVPSTAALFINGQQPTVISGQSTSRQPATATLVITGQLATLQARIQPATGALALVSQRPVMGTKERWHLEELVGAKNGVNQDFNVSFVPTQSSMMVVYNGVRLVQVAREPSSGEAEYGLSGTSVRLGKAPASTDDVWTRYFTD